LTLKARPLISFLLLVISSALLHGQALPYACTGSTESYGVQAGLANSVFFWDVEGGQIVSGQGNDTIAVQWNFDRGSHSITVTEQSEHGCFGIPVTAQLDVQAPVADIGDEEGVCTGDSYTFDAETSYGYALTYLWSDNSTHSTFVTSDSGSVWVQVTGADGCIDYDSAHLELYPLPDVYLGKDTALCGNEAWYVNAGNYAAYHWSTGDVINPLMVDGRRTEPEVLWVEVTDFNGCVGSDTLILEVCDAYVLFASMPNTITPGDKDGKNDTWVIPNIDLFPQAVLEIYDRWGRLIYRTDDVYNNPWNGESMSGREMPMDAYYYVLDIGLSHIEPMTGYINLIR
jgi:gliding motility-associated-like protein